MLESNYIVVFIEPNNTIETHLVLASSAIKAVKEIIGNHFDLYGDIEHKDQLNEELIKCNTMGEVEAFLEEYDMRVSVTKIVGEIKGSVVLRLEHES